MIEEFKAKYQELAAKKRAELEGAIQRGEVQDPFTIAGVVITWQAIALSAAVSIAASAASYAISRAFAPKPQRQSLGRLSGSLTLQNSEQGIMIPEIYGAGPAASIVAGASPTYQNKTNCTDGANGSITKTSGAADTYNAGASHNTTVLTGQDAFIRVIRGTGHAAAGFFDTASPTGSGPDATGMIFGVAWHPAGPMYPVINGVGIEVGNTIVGDEFTIEVRSGRFHLYKGSAEILTFGSAIPAQPASMWFGVIMYTTGAGVSNAKIKIDAIGDPPNYAKGGIKVPAIIDWSSGIRKIVSVTEQPVGGGKGMGGQTQTTENFTYKIDLGLKFCRGPVSLLRAYGNADVLIDQMDTSLLLTGVYDPTIGEDDPYDPELPPDPQTNYALALDRQNATIPFDGDGVGTGTLQGGGSNFAIYSGTETQEPDPTEESDIDAKYGAGSTTAHRGKARIVFNDFDLSRWGGIVPNMTAAWEHQTLTTLDAIYASLCERVNVKTANGDYDLSGLSTIKPRGMLIAGRLFSPSEVMGSLEIQTVYNYFVTEAEGQIIGFIEGAEPSVTIADTQIGWMESDADVADILPEVETVMASEIALPRQVDVKYIDLDKDWDVNTQSDNRQITEGVSTELLEVQLALLASEARSAAQRKLYRDYVAGSVHKFTLPWTYLYLYPGYRITITRAEGFSHVLKLTSISGGLGVLECEGVAIEPAAFTQPAVGSYGPGIQPVQLIPAMTILSFLDTPFLRDRDVKQYQGAPGFYVDGVPRTGVEQSWLGFALYESRNNNWNLIGHSRLPATIGTIVSATGLNTTDTSVFDRTGVFVVDLYGTTASLSSTTEADVLFDAAKNLAVFGDMVSQFVTATQVGGFPNRWTISLLLNGRKGTESHITDTFTGARFVLVNDALVFVPAEVNDINNEFDYRGVTVGQSLSDAAIVPFTWTGGTAKPLPPSSLRGERDSANNLLIMWNRRTRIGAGMRPYSDVPVAEEIEQYEVEVYSGSDVVRTMKPVYTGMRLPALLEGSGTSKFTGISVSNLIPSVPTTARTLAEITQTGNIFEGTLQLDPTGGGFVMIGLALSNAAWNTAWDDVNTARSITGLVVTPWPASTLLILNDYYVPTVENGHKYKVTTAGTTGATEPTWPTTPAGTVASGTAVFTEDGSTILPGAAAMPYLVILEAKGSGGGGFWQRLYVYQYGTRIFNASSKNTQADYSADFGWVAAAFGQSIFRVKFNMVGSAVLIQKAHRADVPLTTIVSGTRALEFPMKGIAGATGSPMDQVLAMIMTISPQPATIYTAAQQATDFGLVPSQVKVRISQISSIVGKGGYAEKDIGVFAATDIAGCRLWLKADTLVLNDGDAVGTWSDSSGLANNATQATAGFKPVYKTNILNGLPAVRFATDDYLTTTQVLTNLSTYFVVYANRTGTNGSFHGGNGAVGGNTPLQRNTQVFPNGNSTVYSITPDTLNAKNLYVSTYDYSADTFAVWLNRVANGTLSGTPTIVDTATFITVGAGYGEFLNGDIAEMAVYDSILSTDDRQRVENYLMDKYGL